MFKASWLMEKRSGNVRLIWLMPLCFSAFSFLWRGAAGRIDDVHSVYATVSINLNTLLFLPITCALLVNSTVKRQKQLQLFLTSNGVNQKRLFWRQLIVNSGELAIILSLEAVIGTLILFISGDVQFLAPSYYWFSLAVVYCCTLPVLAISLVISQLSNRVITLLVNFGLGIASAVIALTKFWWALPWTYSMRSVASLLAIHPNGTILQPEDPVDHLLQPVQNVWSALFLSSIIFIIFLLVQVKIGGSKNATLS